MGNIPMSSAKTAWVGRLEWSYSDNYVTVTMYTWKTDGYPSSSASGANFTATITIGESTKTFSFQQQEKDTMEIGSHRAYASGNSVYISGCVDAPYGVSMYGYPLTGGSVVTLYEEENGDERYNPSQMSIPQQRVHMGEELLITIIPREIGCFHHLTFSVNAGEKALQPVLERLGTSYLWTVPDLMDYCSEDLSCRVTIGCETYVGFDTYRGYSAVDVIVTAYPETSPSCPGTIDIGNTLAITLPRSYSKYVHDIQYTVGDNSGQVVLGVEAAFQWLVPLELSKLIPTQTSTTATLECITRWGETEIGRKQLQVLMRVPDNDETKPTGTMTLTPSGSLPEQFMGMFIRGQTGVQATFTGKSEYSQVDRFELTVDGITTRGNPAESAYLNSHGNVTVTGRIIDARGYAREITQEIAVIAYDKPRVIPYEGEPKVVAVRCDYPDGIRNPKGQSLLIRAGRKYTALNTGGNQLNFCELSFRYKTASSENYSDYYTLISESNLNGDFTNVVIENAVPELKTGYTVQVRAADTLGNYSVITIPVAALTLPFHIGKGHGNVAVGKYCDYSRENAFEVALTTYFDTGIALREIFQGSSWAQGADLGSTVAAADTGAVGSYTLFMGVLNQEPVWLMKVGNKIRGSGVTITLNDSIITLDTAPAAMTALYAVL